MKTKENIAFLKENGYRAWSNGMGMYWVFGEYTPHDYICPGYMGFYVGYLNRGDLALMVRDLEDLAGGY